MREHLRISRRTILRGLGAAVALPWLEAMTPFKAFGAPDAAPTVRMAFCYVPNGVVVPEWTPAKEGAAFELSPTLQPLTAIKDKLLVLTSLAHKKAFANGDGPGDHARAMATFLTGCQAKKTSGADIKVGVSVDQIAAQKIGKATKFASLEIGCEQAKDAGNCDSGYSCAYSNNLSWRGESTPNYKEIDPRAVFDRLFGLAGKTDLNKDRADIYRKSVLDFVSEDAAELNRKLGATDQRKLDEYLSAVREIEQRLAKAAAEATPKPTEATEKKIDYPRPIGYSKEKYQEHLRLMADMLVVAFQADLTRTVTFAFANDGSNRSYRFLDVPEGHHDLSHHGNDKAKLTKIQKINQFHIEQLAYLLTKLDGVKEGSGTLLDNSMVVYGSGISDGDKHNHNELPVLLAGKGGGTIKTGRHIKYPKDTPMTNLFLSMLDRAGASVDSIGDSTGRLKGLDG
jgi:hypothetical protein